MASEQSNVEITVNFLHLNDFCSIKILRYLSLVDLCSVAETCIHLQYVARQAFISGHKSYGIPHQGIKFTDHERILKNFGSNLLKMSVINITHLGMNSKKLIATFDWLERYCANTLQELTIVCFDQHILPPSAGKVMSKLKKIELFSSISERNARAALQNCKELIELKMVAYDHPFQFPDYHFPLLRKLDHRIRVDHKCKFDQIETFFKNHSELIELSTQFLIDGRHHYSINLSYIKHLMDLEKLRLTLVDSKIEGIEAFAHLKKLKELAIDKSDNKQTDSAILECLASVDTLVKLELGIPEFSHLIPVIERFKNLSKLAITDRYQPPFRDFDTNISCLAQLSNIHLTELEINCRELLNPETIVDVVRNLTEIKILKLFCEVELSEAICKQLAAICAAQKRKIEVILKDDIMSDSDFDFKFIGRFNKTNGAFIDIKTEK